MNQQRMSQQRMEIHGVAVEDTFAEAFDMRATRIVITAHDVQWAREAAAAMTGFGTSVIACGLEIDVERELTPAETPDGRPGLAILAFAVSGKELEKQIPRRAGQCVLTCPTTALYAGIEAELCAGVEAADAGASAKKISLGESLRYFGDGHQISKVTGGKRYWRIPVMDGEFICEHDVAAVGGIGGGNFLLFGESLESVSRACRAAAEAIRPLAGVITPFPGGATRSGSKVGSKYPALVASTNEAYCPTLRGLPGSALEERAGAVLEVVIDGLDTERIAEAMREGITAACEAGADSGLLGVSAGNYGGTLGSHHFHLRELFS